MWHIIISLIQVSNFWPTWASSFFMEKQQKLSKNYHQILFLNKLSDVIKQELEQQTFAWCSSIWIFCCFGISKFWEGLTYSSLQTNTDTFANSADPDEMAYNELSHWDLHCFPFCYLFLTKTPICDNGCTRIFFSESISETQDENMLWILIRSSAYPQHIFLQRNKKVMFNFVTL